MIWLYLLVLAISGVYSYSQIDLNLTLLSNPLFLSFQSAMIQLGYFYRPLSTSIFIILLSLFSILYSLFSRASEKLASKQIKILILGLVILGLFSYPAFSHDIFNYIFDARILVTHQQNPYTATALMFPADDWTRFMNWTHRTYPYGPAFLPITALVYLFGLGKFTLTLLLFKALMIAAYLGSAMLIYRLAKKPGFLLFALNPLIIFEVIISGHLDIIMLFFALLSYYFFQKGKQALSLLSILISIAVKYATLTLLPAFLPLKKVVENRINLLILLSFIGVLAQAVGREILPHYFIVPLGFMALKPTKKMVLLSLVMSFLLLLIRYYSFIAEGIWSPLKFF